MHIGWYKTLLPLLIISTVARGADPICIPTPASEIFKPDVFQVFFENDQLLHYLSHTQALALQCCCNKYICEQTTRYRMERVEHFDTTFATSNNLWLHDNDDKKILIAPGSVIFDASGNYACGVPSNYNLPNSTYKFDFYTFSYPSCKVITKEQDEIVSRLSDAITTKKRSLAYMKTDYWCDIDDTHREAKQRAIALTWSTKRDLVRTGYPYNLKSDHNTISYDTQATFYLKNENRYACDTFFQIVTYTLWYEDNTINHEATSISKKLTD